MQTRTTTEDRTLETFARSALYGACSQALAYPTREQVEQLTAEDLPIARSLADRLGGDVGAALVELERAFLRTELPAIEAAHRNVFSHVHAVDAPPYETDYTAREIWRQSQQLADLAGFYRAFGLDPVGERADAISVELEFAHVVVYKRVWAELRDEPEHAEVCRRAEEAFLREHLLRWGPGFGRRVHRLGGDGPYGAVGRLLWTFLASEAERLGMEVVEDLAPAAPVVSDEPGLCEGA
jgi:TorA maturation chaperone TorD